MSWDNLGLSTLIVGVLRTAEATLHPGKINSKQEKNAIVNNVVDEILLNETQKVSAKNNEAPKFMESD